MGVVLVVVAAAAVFVIAAVAVGRFVGQAKVTARRSVYDLDEAVEFVADRLPGDVQARLSYEDVHRLLGWHLDHLEASGVAFEVDEQFDGAALGPTRVLDENRAVAYVLGAAASAGLEVSDLDVALVLAEEDAYLLAIGAVGPALPGDRVGDRREPEH